MANDPVAHNEMSQDGKSPAGMKPDETNSDEISSEETGSDAMREEASRGPRAGVRLKLARQARNISLDEIARELHLDADRLRDLEANRFGKFSAPVFTKGYLRRYAGLVGVAESEVLADFDELSDAAGPPPVVVKSRQARARSVPSLQTILLVLLAVLLGGLGWWAFSGAVLKPAQETDTAGAPVDREAPAAATVAGEPLQLPAADTADESVQAAVEEDRADTSAGPQEELLVERGDASAASAPADAVGITEVALTLSFSDECWLQVTGGDGERLFAGIARGGQVRRFAAEPPVSIVLGNADAASIEVNGEPYVIDPADRRGRTARITVAGP